MRTLSIATPTHGRVLVRDGRDAAGTPSFLIGFHGYGQRAEDLLQELERIAPDDRWTLASLQGLHRFYTRDNQTVIASWMTRQDREDAIADNMEYVAKVLDALGPGKLVFVGFSQGAAMAYRAALLGHRRAAGLIVLGGDVPPDVKGVPADRWPPLLIGAGDTDYWYTPTKVAADAEFLHAHGVAFDLFRFPAGHEWTDAFRERARALLGST